MSHRIFFLEFARLLMEYPWKCVKLQFLQSHSVVSLDSGCIYGNKYYSVSLFRNLFACKFKIYKWPYTMKLHLKFVNFFSANLAWLFFAQTHKCKPNNHLYWSWNTVHFIKILRLCFFFIAASQKRSCYSC